MEYNEQENARISNRNELENSGMEVYPSTCEKDRILIKDLKTKENDPGNQTHGGATRG